MVLCFWRLTILNKPLLFDPVYFKLRLEIYYLLCDITIELALNNMLFQNNTSTDLSIGYNKTIWIIFEI